MRRSEQSATNLPERPLWLMRCPIRLRTQQGHLDINGPLRFLEKLLLHSPLVVWAPFASNVSIATAEGLICLTSLGSLSWAKESSVPAKAIRKRRIESRKGFI